MTGSPEVFHRGAWLGGWGWGGIYNCTMDVPATDTGVGLQGVAHAHAHTSRVLHPRCGTTPKVGYYTQGGLPLMNLN